MEMPGLEPGPSGHAPATAKQTVTQCLISSTFEDIGRVLEDIKVPIWAALGPALWFLFNAQLPLCC